MKGILKITVLATTAILATVSVGAFAKNLESNLEKSIKKEQVAHAMFIEQAQQELKELCKENDCQSLAHNSFKELKYKVQYGKYVKNIEKTVDVIDKECDFAKVESKIELEELKVGCSAAKEVFFLLIQQASAYSPENVEVLF